MVSKTALCKVGAVSLFLVAAALFVFGFLVVGVVDTLIKDGVKDSLKLEPKDIDEEFRNSTNVKYNAYVYNISNWPAFSSGAASPEFTLVGPYVYQESAVKFNDSFNGDETLYQYNEFFNYTLQTDSAMTDSVYVVNPVMLSVMATYFRTLPASFSTEAAATARNVDSLLDEGKVVSNIIMPPLWGLATPQFSFATPSPSTSTLTFRSNLPGLVFDSYYKGLLSKIATDCPIIGTEANLRIQWANKSIVTGGIHTCNSTLVGWVGFEIGTLNEALANALLNDASGINLRKSGNVSLWTLAYAGNATFRGALAGALGGNAVVTAVLNYIGQLWFNTSYNSNAYQQTAVAVVSGGLDAGFVNTGKWGAPELGPTGWLGAADFDDPTRDIAILNRYKALWNLTSLQYKFDNLAMLQFSTGLLTAGGGSSTFLDSTSKQVFGLHGTGANAVPLDGLEYARYLATTVPSMYDGTLTSAENVQLINNSAPGCVGFTGAKYKSCVYMANTLSLTQAAALLNPAKMTSTAIVTRGSLRRSSVSPLSNTADTMNTFLGIFNTSDAITPEALNLLGDYFCDKLPFSAGYKGRMLLNSGADNDFKLGGLFVKKSPHQVFTGYKDRFVPTTEFYYPTLSTFSDASSSFAVNPYSPHVMYTGKSDINQARWWKAFRGVSNLTSWTDTSVEDVLSPTALANRVAESLQYWPRNSGKVWKTSEILDGTSDGRTAGPFREDEQPAVRTNLYVSQARRSAKLELGEAQRFKGIKMYRYTLSVDVLKNSTEQPSNDKYYMGRPFNTSQFENPRGLVPLARMARGVPVFLSPAGFYNVEPALWQGLNLQKKLDGASTSSLFNPSTALPENKERFDTFLDMEPLSGATMRANKRLQINVWVPKTWIVPQASVIPAASGQTVGKPSRVHADFFAFVANETGSIPSTQSRLFMPLTIYDEAAEIKDKDADKFKSKIYNNRDIADALRIAFIAGGGFFMLVALGCFYHYHRKADSSITRLDSKQDMTT